MSQKERIIREATAMFFDQGLKSVRMDDIATGLGVSKRTLYEMFGDKKALLEECVAYHIRGKRQMMHDSTANAHNVMEEIFELLSHMKRDEREAAFMGNLKKFYPEIFKKWIEEGHRYSYEQLDKMFDRGINEGLFLADMNKELALVTLVYTMAALFERKYYLPIMDKVPPREMFDYVIVNYFRGLATDKGIHLIDELVVKYRKERSLLNENS